MIDLPRHNDNCIGKLNNQKDFVSKRKHEKSIAQMLVESNKISFSGARNQSHWPYLACNNPAEENTDVNIKLDCSLNSVQLDNDLLTA